MKKLKMILSSVVVLAIVGGAFAFKTKAGAFCVLSGTTSGNCTTFKQNVRITTTGGSITDYRYYPAWDGTQSVCTQDNAGRCTAQFKLIND